MATNTTCYSLHGGTLGIATISIPCGIRNDTNRHVPCCVKGDTCLANGICHYTHSLTGGSGYYSSDCTDPSFADAACVRRCTNKRVADIVYNTTSHRWACCSYNPNPNCDEPSDELFDAPAPANLASVQYIPMSGSPTYAIGAATATATTSGSGPTGTESSSPKSSSSGLSTGAQAGIGVGAALAVIAVIAALGLFFFRRRKRGATGNNVHGAAPQAMYGPPQEMGYPDSSKTYRADAKMVSQPTPQRRPAELEATTPVAEMAGSTYTPIGRP